MIAGNDVTTLLAEYLDKSKIELGQLEYIPSEFDVVTMVNEILSIFKVHAEQKGVELTHVIDPHHKYFIYADQARIKEVVINVIDNSIKYTPHGSIDVTVTSKDGHVIIKVSDTGVGIEAETIPVLFKEFSRADLQKVNILGSGLGLFLAKKFTEAQKGQIWAESEGKDKGAQFYITFPEIKHS